MNALEQYADAIVQRVTRLESAPTVTERIADDHAQQRDRVRASYFAVPDASERTVVIR